jgi:hypothetical protein
MTEKTKQGNHWHSAIRPARPISMKPVLVDVDGMAREGHWNEKRSMWFCGERPIYPLCWRPMPLLPKGKR